MTQLAVKQMNHEVADSDINTVDQPVTTLDRLPVGEARIVHDVRAPADAPEWVQWLEEIGFIAGERVTLMARGMPGGDPLVVRVGLSTFALRRAEAACVHVARD
jgi:ferrous iron transport protein A